MEQDTLSVAVAPPHACMRISGRGSFKVAPAFKRFAAAATERGCRIFSIDMRNCSGMDSTFMGVLAGVAMRLRKSAGGGEVRLLDVDAKNAGLLETLGLTRVLQLTPKSQGENGRDPFETAPELESLDTRPVNRAEAARTVLAAHENLVEAAPENRPRFQDVLTYLKENIRREASSDGGNDRG